METALAWQARTLFPLLTKIIFTNIPSTNTILEMRLSSSPTLDAIALWMLIHMTHFLDIQKVSYQHVHGLPPKRRQKRSCSHLSPELPQVYMPYHIKKIMKPIACCRHHLPLEESNPTIIDRRTVNLFCFPLHPQRDLNPRCHLERVAS